MNAFVHRALAVLCGLGLLSSTGLGQDFGSERLEWRASLEFSSAVALMGAAVPSGSWGLGAHLEARYRLEFGSLNLTLDPGVRFGTEVRTEAGLTEAYLLVPQGEFDLGIGIERLPLEVARLSLPYSLEPLGEFGQRKGLPVIRVSWNPEGARVRLAVLEVGCSAVPVLSLRRAFGDFELEGHALYRDDRAVLGLGGSGTLGTLVFYGEVWALTNPLDWRYAFGASGSLPDGLWTLEGGYTSVLPGAAPRRSLIGSAFFSQGENVGWNFSGALFFDTDAVRGQMNLAYSVAQDEANFSSSLTAHFGPQVTVWIARIVVQLFL